jgi:hypothetical protein
MKLLGIYTLGQLETKFVLRKRGEARLHCRVEEHNQHPGTGIDPCLCNKYCKLFFGGEFAVWPLMRYLQFTLSMAQCGNGEIGNAIFVDHFC